jgi:hypothetical protein
MGRPMLIKNEPKKEQQKYLKLKKWRKKLFPKLVYFSFFFDFLPFFFAIIFPPLLFFHAFHPFVVQKSIKKIHGLYMPFVTNKMARNYLI